MSGRVSVIVAAYNEERHIAECLDSLLAQTYGDMDVLVADDGSKDRTAEVVRRYPSVRLLNRPHEGKASAINAAAREVSGDIVVFLDGDLWFEPTYIERLIAPILSGQCLGTSHAEELVANPSNAWSRCLQSRHGLPPERRLMLSDDEVRAGTIVFRALPRERFLAVGGFSDTGFLDDRSLFLKLGQRACFVRGALCRHHNPERLGEVFASGVWGGKSVHYLHGARALVRYAPPLAVLRAVADAVRHRMPAMLVYLTVYETGVFWGVLKRALGVERQMGA
ncbi:MAG: glycosyltransferase family 2 protein [Gemmatimonadales bacterium]